MRGKVVCVLSNHRRSRITPACAGTSQRHRGAVRSRTDHPRLCGEKVMGGAAVMKRSGSPPPVRGKGRQKWYANCRARITPACAGKRKTYAATRHMDEDHPRLCGEKISPSHVFSQDSGSPPPVRGKASRGTSSSALSGITPACTGKRSGCANVRPMGEDHPRLCGEKAPGLDVVRTH